MTEIFKPTPPFGKVRGEPGANALLSYRGCRLAKRFCAGGIAKGISGSRIAPENHEIELPRENSLGPVERQAEWKSSGQPWPSALWLGSCFSFWPSTGSAC